jgi:hypothetical protein
MVEITMIGPRFGVASSAALSGAATGMTTRAPVFDCRNLMCVCRRRRTRAAATGALPLSGPQCEQQRQVQLRRGVFEKCRFVFDAPHEVDARAVIDAESRENHSSGTPFRTARVNSRPHVLYLVVEWISAM